MSVSRCTARGTVLAVRALTALLVLAPLTACAGASGRTAPSPTFSYPPLASPPAPPDHTTRIRVADYAGLRLDEAYRKAREQGFRYGSHDATEKDERPRPTGWAVCFQTPAAGSYAQSAPMRSSEADALDFAAVPFGQPCPPADGRPIGYPALPDVVGKTSRQAYTALGAIGIRDIRPSPARPEDDLPDVAEKHEKWRVCQQTPAAGQEIDNPHYQIVRLDLVYPGSSCPPEPGAVAGGDSGSGQDTDVDTDIDVDGPDVHLHRPGICHRKWWC
ncbi:PASTA domain-containing protein [Streptomyces sp. NPDC087228]|uniref:PASTA domain-containing protein n=1 Tax=unclassified Streptomyces TaxID=2593676 RepID=UPI00382AE088